MEVRHIFRGAWGFGVRGSIQKRVVLGILPTFSGHIRHVWQMSLPGLTIEMQWLQCRLLHVVGNIGVPLGGRIRRSTSALGARRTSGMTSNRLPCTWATCPTGHIKSKDAWTDVTGWGAGKEGGCSKSDQDISTHCETEGAKYQHGHVTCAVQPAIEPMAQVIRPFRTRRKLGHGRTSKAHLDTYGS